MCQATLCQNLLCQIGIHELKDPLHQKNNMQWIIEMALFVCFCGFPNLPLQKQDFSCSGGPKWDTPVTFERKVREQNQLGFWNMSIRPTSGASFIKFGRPTFSTSGTLSQKMTLKLENLLRWSHFTFIYNRSTNMNYFIYIFHMISLCGKIWTQQIDLAPNVWLHSSVGRASHRYRGGHGFESRWSPDFFQASFQLLKLENLLRWSHFTFTFNMYLVHNS